MGSKGLNALFEQLLENENKLKEQKNLVNELRAETEEKSQQLSQSTHELKRLEQEFDSKSKLIPNAISDLTVIDIEIDIFCQQIIAFETKVEENRQKIIKLNANRKQRIDELVEKSFSFAEQFGPKGSVRIETINCRKRIENLQKIRNELKEKAEKLKINSKDFELVLKEKNSLNDEICVLEKKRNKEKNENFELKCIAKRLENSKKALKEKPNFDQEFVELRKQLQSIEVKERSFQVERQFRKTSELYSNPNPNVLSGDRKEKPLEVIEVKVEPIEPLEPLITIEENRFRKLESNSSETKGDLKRVKEEQKVWDLKRKRRQHSVRKTN